MESVRSKYGFLEAVINTLYKMFKVISSLLWKMATLTIIFLDVVPIYASVVKKVPFNKGKFYRKYYIIPHIVYIKIKFEPDLRKKDYI